MTGYEKGCEELGLRGSGAQAIGSKRTSFGGKRPASLGRTVSRGVEEVLALKTLSLIGGREGGGKDD